MNVFVHLLESTFSFLYKLASTSKALQRTSAPFDVVEKQDIRADYFTNYKVRLMRKTRLQQMVWVLPMLFLAFAARGQDLSTHVYTSATTTTIGGQLTFKISVRNDAHLAVTGVQVTSTIPSGTTWVSDDGGGAYNKTTGLWTIGAIGAAVDSVVLNLTVQVATEGVIFSQAEVTAMVEPDGDSTPNNGSVIEDDWSSACATIPIHYNCRDDINALASAPTGYTAYQWYKNGVAISGADKDTYRIREIGDFNFTASTPTTNCPASLCCPITVVRDSCMSLGNLVFEDKDNNGTFNGTDVGLNGIEVQLYFAGLDGLKGTADDELDSTITTANGGLYLFENLDPGVYYVKLTGTGIPSGYVSSTGGGPNDFTGAGTFEPSTSGDVDNEDHGSQMSAMVMSNLVTLTLNGEPTSEDGSANSNLTVDFGLYKPVCIVPDIAAANPTAICEPDSIDAATITVTDANNVSGATTAYFATANDAFANTNALTNTVVSTVGTTTIWIRKTNPSGGCFDTVSVQITINPKPVYADASITVCAPANVNLTTLVTGYGSIVNPVWTIGSLTGATVSTPTSVTPSVSTTYFLVGENASGCKDTAEVAVTVTPKPNIGADQSLACSGITAPTTYDFATTGTWVVLTQPATASASISNAGAASNMTVAGQYTFEITVNGCKDTAVITIPNCACTSPDISASSPAAVCEFNTIDVSTIVVTDANNISGNLTYFVTANDAFNNTNALTSTIISSSQTVWIRKTDLAGFCFDTVSVQITINPKPVYADGSITVCAPANVNLTTLVTGYGSIVNPVWTIGTVTGSVESTPTNVTPSVSTTYFLVGENASGCKDTAEVAVTVTPKPNIGADQSLACSGITAPTTYDFATTGTWVVLTQPATASAAISGMGAASNMTVAGQYTFEITVNGCKDTAVITVEACNPTLDLGDLVFEDKNNNGIFDGTDVGIENIEVILFNIGVDGLKNTADDIVIDTLFTDPNGNYLFAGLDTGRYFVKLNSGIPSGMVSSTGDGVTDTDGAGAFEPSTASDVDKADNGTQMGTMVMSNIITLTYYGEPTNDGDTSSLTNLTVDFGLYTPQPIIPTLSLGDLVWNDANNDGIKQNTEGGIENVRVVLYGVGTDGLKNTADDVAIDSVLTGSTGGYLFTGLDAGNYYVKLSSGIPSGMVSSTGGGVHDTDGTGTFEPSTASDVNDTDNGSQMGTMVMSNIITLSVYGEPVNDGDTSSLTNLTVDFGLYTPQPIVKDTLFVSVPVDSTTNPLCPTGNDVGTLASIIVTTCEPDGVADFGTYTTNAQGCVVYTAGHTASQNADTLCVIYIDVLGFSDTTVWIVSVTPKALIGNLVWNDTNNDGIKQNTEGGIANVDVVLYRFDYTTSAFVPFDTIATDNDGKYLFTGLDSGSYYVKLPVIPSGFSSSTGDGPTDVDGAGTYEPSTSTADNADHGTKMGTMIISDPFVLTVGQIDTTRDFGFYVPQSITCDCPTNQDLVPPTLVSVPNNVTLNCQDAVPTGLNVTGTDNCSPNVTVFISDVQVAGSCASNYVITRTWTATDLCGNTATASRTITVQDVTPPTLANVPVNMTLTCGQAVPTASNPTATDVCDNNPNVAMVETTPTATTIVRTWTATDACGNSTTASQTITLTPCKLQLGDLVFNDANNDGTHQNTEGGIENVRVVLYGVGTDGLKNTSDDIAIDSVLTSSTGNYLFTNLDAGNYYVKLSSGIPSGMVSSTGGGVHDTDGAGTFEPSTASDVNDTDNGSQMGTMVMSNIITLSIFGEPTNDGDTSSLTNLTVDFGLYTPQPITPDTLYVSIPVDSTTNPLCPTGNDIGTIVSTTVTTCEADGVTDFGTYTVDAQGCAVYTAGNVAGSKVDTLCVVAIDGNGNRDTTVWIISIAPKLSLGNLVWNDANNDGIYQNTEGGIENVRVVLYGVGTDGLKNTADDVKIDSVLTSSTGNYLFTNLDAGNYYVKLSSGIPSGMVSSTGGGVHDTDGAGTFEPSTASDVNDTDNGSQMGTMVMSNIITLSIFGEPTNDGDTSSLTNLTVDFGLYTPQPITPDTLFVTISVDSTTNPLCPTGNDIGTIVSRTVTTCEADGVTDFGTYTVDAQGCAVYTAGNVAGSKVDTLCVVAIDGNGNRDTTVWIISITPKLSLGNLVWNDANNDGIHQGTEGGIQNVRVVLYGVGTDGLKNTADDVKIDSVLTSNTGAYLFTGLNAGNYYVKLSSGIPSGMISSTGDGVNDSDGAGAYEPSSVGDVNNIDHGSQMGTMVMSNIITLSLYGEPTNDGDTSSLTNLTVDFGLYTPQPIVPTLSLGNSVFNDEDNDGVQGATEVGIPNVQVVLYAVGNDGLKNTADDVKLDSVLTNFTGNYLFTGLSEGNYYVKLSSGIPTNMVSSTGQGVNDTDGAGPYEPSTVGDINEADHGSQMGTMIMSGIINLTLYGEPTNDGDTSSLTNLTVDFGLYTPHLPNATLTIGNLVWHDANNDGIHQSGESGIENVLVTLYNVGGDNMKGTADDFVVTDTRTDSVGHYLFPLLSEGNYYVKLNGSGIPSGMVSSTGDGVTDTDGAGAYEPSTLVDINDVDNGTVMGNMIMSNVVVLRLYSEPTDDGDVSSLTNLSVDFGLYTPNALTSSVGNLVWNDANNDGIHQNTEGGMPNVTVALYVLNTTTNTYDFVNSVLTNSNGEYNFTGLTAGTYYVKLPTIPSGMSSSTGDGPTDTDGAGSFEPSTSTTDNQDHGFTMGSMIITQPFTLAAGVSDSTIDFGLYTPQSIVCDCATQQDLIAPTLVGVPQNLTLNCSDNVPNATVTATDNCTQNITPAMVESRSVPTCVGSYTITRTWTATDLCGNTARATQTITIQDITAPIFSNVPVNMTLNCGQSVPTAANPTLTDCDATPSLTMAETTPTATTIVRTWTATDACGNASTASQTITLTPCKLSLGDLVFNDANNDGIHQNTEGGIENVRVVLYNLGPDNTKGTADDVKIDSVLTSNTGAYLFTNLDAGRYYVKLSSGIPSGMVSSTGGGVNDTDGAGIYEPSTSIDVNNVDKGTQMGSMVMSNIITLTLWNEPTNDGDTSSLTNLTVDFGLYTPQIPKDTLYVTIPVDSTTNPLCPTADNIGTVVSRTVTTCEADGVTDFGTYTVDAQGCAVYTAGSIIGTHVDTLCVVAVDGNGNRDTTVWIISITPKAIIGNLVWNDANNDGIHQNTEGGIPNVDVVLYKYDNVTNTYIPFDTLTTDANGKYLFTGLDTGRYYVKLPTIPSGMSSSTGDGPTDNDGAGTYEPSTATADNADHGSKMGTMIVTEPFTLTAGQVDTTRDFGLYVPQSITCDCPTQQDLIAPTLVGLPSNTTLNCQDVLPNGALVTATDNCSPNVAVSFADVKVDGNCANNYVITRTWRAVDLCGNVSTASRTITVQDITVPVLAGVPTNITLNCQDALPTGTSVTATDNCTQNVQVIMSDDLVRGTCAGNYVITRTWTATDLCGNSATASQVITVRDITVPTLANVPVNITLACGQAVPTAVNPTASDSCSANVAVTMAQTTPTATTIVRTWTATDACGNTATASQTITFAPCKLSVGNIVFNDANNDGIHQNTEGGIENVRVVLYGVGTDGLKNTADDVKIDSVLTSNTGAYLFTNLDAGNYYIKLSSGMPSGMVSSTGDGVADTDGAGAFEPSTSVDVNDRDNGTQMGTMVMSNIINLTVYGEPTNDGDTSSLTNLTVDFGLYTPVQPRLALSLGNIVWDDSNNDGIKDANEAGLNGVQVVLYGVGTDGLKNTNDDVKIDSVLTAGGGQYLFTGLNEGRYFVKLTGQGIPTGYVSSTGGGPADIDGAGAFEPSTTGDVNSFDHGTQMGVMVMSNIIDLTYYGEPTNDGDTSSLSNLTVDFGLYRPLSPLTLSLGNVVWNDTNNNGIYETASEGGVANVMVILYGVGTDGLKNTADDISLDTVFTNGSGNYLFTDLTAGNYFVKLTNIPSGMVSSTGDGPADRDNSGAFEPTTEGDVNNRDHGTQMGSMVMSNIVTLTSNGEPTNDGDTDPNTNLTIDFGLYTPIDTGVFDLALIKKLVPRQRGTIVNNGDTVRFRMTVINQGTANAHDIRIKDYVPNGLQFIPALNTAVRTGNGYDWAADTTLLVDDLNAGATLTADIILVVNHAPRDTFFLNKSEIIFATNTEGSLVNTTDRDSRADTDPNNDRIGKDNAVNNRNGDEDDHDYAFVIDYPDKDPIGYIYCDKTGKILMGGTIDVEGPGIVYIIEDGSTGRYQFFTDGTPGTYTLSYSHPDNFPMSTTCAAQSTALDLATVDGSAIDKDGLLNGFAEIGTGDTLGGYLTDKTCANNPYYLQFTSSVSNEPVILHNNLPIQCSFIGALSCKDNNYNSLIDAGDTQLDSVKVYLYNCLTNALLDSTISVRGQYGFDGLRSGSYKVRASLPNGYRYSATNVSGNPLADSRLDSAGYSACINLNFGECDTTSGRFCFIPQIFDLALRKTLAAGQAAAVNVGDTVTYTIQVFNQGSMDAYDIDVVDYIPTGLTLVDPTWTANGPFVRKTIAGPLAFGTNTPLSIQLKVTGTNNQYVNVAEISRASDRRGGAAIQDIDSQADSTDTNDRGGRWNVVGENDNINGGINGDEDDSDPAVINVNNVRNPCNVSLNPDFAVRDVCALGETQFTATAGFNSYAWSFGDGATAGNEQTTLHTYGTPTGGNYTVTLYVTNAQGCTDSVKKQVIINPMVWADAGVDKYLCEGDSVQLGAAGGTHYSWLPAGTLNNGDIFNPIATPSVTTTYYVFVSNDFGCTGVDSVTVFVNPRPRIVSRTGSLSTCSNGVMPVRIQIDKPIASYQIVGSGGYSNVVVSGSTLSFNATLNGALNNMAVELTDASGCSVVDTFNLYLAGNPDADFVVIEPFCNNAETTLLFTGTATPAAVLTYDLADGVIVRRSAATATRPFGDTTVVRFPTFGSKLLKLVVNDGGCLDNATKSIFVRKSPKTVIANNDTTICPNVCVPLYGTAGILDCVYTWTPATGLSSTNTAYTIACPLVTTTYYLTIMDINGCASTDSVTITVQTPPVLVGVPANVTVECNAIPAVATVTERSGLRVVYNEVRTAGNCPNAYTLTRTWTATNYCNLTTTGTQIITVQDRTNPILANVPRNVTISCDEPVPANVGVTATDNCDANPLITSNDVRTAGNCANNYTITRTWIARDACNNTSSASQVISVQDLGKPMLMNVPMNMTLSCDAALPSGTGVVTAMDNCDAAPRITFADVRTAGYCPNAYTLARTWTATDACGNTSTASQIIIVLDLTKPILAGVPADITIECDATVPTPPTVTATDNCDTNPINVVFAQKRTNTPCGYTLLRTWTAIDACGNAQTGSQVITVEDRTKPSFGNTPLTVTIDCIEKLNTVRTPSVTDNCDANPTLTFVQSVSDSTCTNKKKITRLYTAKDACGNTQLFTQTIIINDNVGPVITPINPLLAGFVSGDTLTMSCENIRLFQLGDATAVDNCAGCTPTLIFEDLAVRRGTCPIDGYSLLMECRWVATDCCGNRSEWRIFIKVTDNQAPILTGVPANITVTSPSQVPTAAIVTATDNCTDSVGVTLTETLVATGVNCNYIITRTWTALDACGNASRKTQLITVLAPPLDVKAVKTDETCLRNDGTITMIPSSGITYVWSDGARGAFRTGLRAGTYTVTATVGLCQKVVTTIILDGCVCQNPVVASIAKTDATCGNSNGSVTVTADTAANYTFNWSSNATGTGLVRSNLAAGFYSVTVTRNNDAACSTILSVQVANNTANCCTQPVATVDKTDATCGGSNGLITVVVDNAANYTFTWSSNAPTSTGPSRAGLSTGTYSITVSRIGVANCSTVVSTTINNNTAGCCTTPIATITKVDETCGGANGSATVAVDNAANYTFTWSANAPSGTGASRTGLANGTYSITVSRIGVANCSTVVSTTINNNTANCCTTPVATITKTDATCGGANGSASVNVDNAANYTFTWSANAPTGTGASRSGLAAGTYSITVSRISPANCSTVVTTTIDNNTGNCCTPPIATITKADATCNQSNGTATVVVDTVANYTFTWSANASAGTGASRINLAAGTYSITVARVNNPTCVSIVTATIANNTEGCCDIIPQTSIVKVLQDCAGTAEVCVEIAPNRLSNYTITDNGVAYAGTFGTCAAGSTLNLAAGEHQLIFTNNLIANCKDTLTVKVVCIRQMLVNRSIQLPATNQYCLTATGIGATGTIVSVINECPSTGNAQFSIDTVTHCVSYKSLSVGMDTACLKITTSTGDVVNMTLAVTVSGTVCNRFIAQDSVIITNACTDSTKACVNIPFDMIPDYNITLNGATYTGALEGCRNDTTLNYSYALLVANNNVGPYDMTAWTVNGTTYTAQGISSMQALVDTMNRFDATGNWQLNSGGQEIVLGQMGKNYGNMVLRSANSTTMTLAANIAIRPNATNLSVLRGRSVLVFTNRLTGCADSVVVNAACITPQRIETTMLKGKTDTFCINTGQLLGTNYRIRTLVNGTNRYVTYSNLAGTMCVSRAALNVGTEGITYVVSDEYGMNDTIYVTTHVTQLAIATRRPVALNDKVSTPKTQPIYINVMDNDTIFTNKGVVTIITEPKRGKAIVTADLRIFYTPDATYCNGAKPEILRYSVCNQAGCDTATVEITVICDKIKVFSAFSPNNDGVNDVFLIEGVELFPNNTLSIYNRWGNQVMTTKGYKNDWAGTWNSQIVPDGTYFYIFNDGEGKTISGSIQIQR